ncbi:MAG: methyltransferase [Thermoleptolyngbya sp. C42_A2020_037]|nr:methyltransferase [Thermoleptolyngbya sp. C42_A2020_037]MBF2084776.1 methyltransferase [Thermoleptolyngbya sp. C42_A2020_037]
MTFVTDSASGSSASLPVSPQPAAPEFALPPEMVIMQMLTGAWVTQCLYVAAKLNLADALQAGPQSIDALAAQVGAHPRSLFRVMRALASVGVFAETEPQHFAMTPLAECLRSDAPNSMQAIALMLGEEHYMAWGGLLGSVQSGGCAFEQLYGTNIFEYYGMNAEPAAIFDRAMTQFSRIVKPAIAQAYDFSDVTTLVDVAGGQGGLLLYLLQQNPHLNGLLFDLPAVIQGAGEAIAQSGVGDRCMVSNGSFFEEVPSGGDAYLLKHIVHDWDDERAIAILKNCRAAMPETGRLLIVEHVVPEGNEPSPSKLMDINMLVVAPGGCERTAEEFRQLLAQAGFALRRVIPTASPVSIIEAVPV